MRILERPARRPVCVALGVVLTMVSSACGGGGSGGGTGSVPAAPTGLVASEGDGEVLLAWQPVDGASQYTVYWDTAPGVTPSTGNAVPTVEELFVHSGLVNGQTYYYVVTATGGGMQGPPSLPASAMPAPFAGPYAPPWAAVAPAQAFTLTYDLNRSAAQNGALLAAAVAGLAPGQRLVVSRGTYALPAPFEILLQGTVAAPIWITAAPGTPPRLTRAGGTEPVATIGGQGTGPQARYLVLRGFEITGGGFGIQLHKASSVWIDGCHVHHTGGGGINATTENTDHLHLTRNDIHDTASYGEGIQLGKNSPNRITHDTVIALNYVHDTLGAIQGDGIDLKLGSHSNWIVENRIHRTKFPCIIFEGTAGNPVNVIERNVCYDSQDNIVQAQGGEAIVRNNLLMSPAGNKIFDSSHNAATLRDLTVVHNTMLAGNGYCAGLFAWNGQPGLVFANNVCTTNTWGPTTYALATYQGQAGGTLEGNVVFGNVNHIAGGFTIGSGLADFLDVTSWNYVPGSVEDFLPSPGGAIHGAGAAAWMAAEDLTGAPRILPADPGCLEAD